MRGDVARDKRKLIDIVGSCIEFLEVAQARWLFAIESDFLLGKETLPVVPDTVEMGIVEACDLVTRLASLLAKNKFFCALAAISLALLAVIRPEIIRIVPVRRTLFALLSAREFDEGFVKLLYGLCTLIHAHLIAKGRSAS